MSLVPKAKEVLSKTIYLKLENLKKQTGSERPSLDSFLSLLAFQVQFQEGKESLATAELYKVLKDHKNPFMQDLVSSSFKHCYQARKAIGHDSLCTQELDECGTENVVRVNPG